MNVLETLKSNPAVFSNAQLLGILMDQGQVFPSGQEKAWAKLVESSEDIARVIDHQLPSTQRTYYAAVELERRRQGQTQTRIHKQEDLLKLVMDMRHADQEQMRAILLDNGHRVKAVKTTHIGTAQGLFMRVAEVLRPAVAYGVPYIIIAHNHPSGLAEPSKDDDLATEQIVAAARLLDIQVLEHLIIAGNGAYSYTGARPELLGMRHMTEEEIAQLQEA